MGHVLYSFLNFSKLCKAVFVNHLCMLYALELAPTSHDAMNRRCPHSLSSASLLSAGGHMRSCSMESIILYFGVLSYYGVNPVHINHLTDGKPEVRNDCVIFLILHSYCQMQTQVCLHPTLIS